MINGEVNELENNGLKTLTFKGYESLKSECARWGPSYSFAVLVERAEYVRCLHRLLSHDWQFVLLRGTKGIGKSVFLFWLIYKLVQIEKTSGKAVPSFLLISGVKDKTAYHLLSVSDGTPLVQRVGPNVSVDYVLSDVEYDPSVITAKWNLNVVSLGAEREPDVFKGKVLDAKQVCYYV